MQPSQALAQLWADAGMPTDALNDVRLTGSDPVLPSSFAVGTAAQVSIAAAGLAAATLHREAGGPAQTVSVDERQALLAAVHIVELDLAGGDVPAALQLARPMALSLRDPRHRAVRYELLTVLFSALLLAGEAEEAHATGRELYDLARALDPGRLHAVLYAMAYLACGQRRYAVAARVVAAADRAHDAHGQLRRRPVDERLRASVLDVLGTLGQAAPCGRGVDRLPDEVAACELALGYDS